MNTEKSYAETKHERFLAYAQEIKELGYKVYICKDGYWNYGYIVNEKDEIGYFQLGDFGYGVRFSTKHKNCRQFGGGFCLDKWDSPRVSPLTKEIVDRVFIHHPLWAVGNANLIKKWTATEFFSGSSVYGCSIDRLEEV